MGLLPLYVAEDQGFFKENGVEVKWIDVRDPGQASRVFFAGDADLLMTTFANILPAEAQKPGSVRLILPAYESSDQPGSYLLVPPLSAINSLNDLKGKSVGTYAGPSQKAYALIFLESLGLKEDSDFNLVQVGTAAQVQSLFGGAFDALFTVEPYGSVAITQGAKVVAEGVRTEFIANPFWVGSAVLHTEFERKNKDSVEGIVRSLEKATEFIAQNNARSREVLAKHTDMAPGVAARCRLYHWVARPSPAQISEMQEHSDLLQKMNLLDKRVEIGPLFASR
jgi:NitT/TauT family transport system substrate-binding protein